MLSHGGAEANNLNVIFLPFLCTSHTIPMIDMARIFAMHGVNITIFTTAGNVGIFQKCIDRDISLGRYIKTHILEFPAQQVGLPIGIETMNANTSLDTAKKIYEASLLLQPRIESYLFDKLFKVDCIVSDMFYTWTVEAAAKLGVPRIVFCPASIFSRCAELSFELHATHTEADSENIKIVGLPHKLEIARLQLPDWLLEPSEFGSIMKGVNDSTRRSYGAVFNSFYDMESAYEEHYKNVFGTKCWSLGPVSYWANQDLSDKAERGDEKVEEGDVLLQWLNSKKENSVIYVSFGSISKFPISQLIEIAHALEASTHDFIWVVRKNNEAGGSSEEGEGFMEEFEKRVRESKKGYLIWGWAPQLLILENKAIGGIVTHCGWNTTIESINAGLPMVTWPLFSEQFFHEKLVVEVLRIGVSIGVRKWKIWNEFEGEVVKREDIGKAIGLVMENGNEAKEMRSRAKALSEDSKKAILVGGSSHANLIQFIEELESLKLQRLNGSI